MKNNQLKQGIYLSYISLFLTNISSLIITPFLVRNLGQNEYGLYMLIGSFIGYIAVLDFGLGNATVRFVAKYRAERDKEGEENFLASTFILYAVISSIVFLIGSIVYLNLDLIFNKSLTEREIEIAQVMFIILIINLTLTLPMKSFTGIVNAYERFAFPKMLVILRTLFRAIAIIVLLSIGYKSIAVVLVDAILNVIMMLLTMYYVFRKLKVRIFLHKINKSLFKEILSYSSLIFISVIVDQIYWRIGHLVLGIVAGTAEVAIFTIGIIFGQYFIVFATSISGVFLPKVTTMVVKNSTGDELTNLLIKTGRFQYFLLGLVLGGFVLFGKKFIFLWVGQGYENSWIIALAVMIPLTIVLTQTIGITILQAKNMHGFRALVYLSIAVINLIISINLAKVYGSIGAVFGTSLSLVLGNIVVMNIYYHVKVKLDMIKFYKETSKGITLSIVISLLLSTLLLFLSEDTWLIFFIQCLIYSMVYSFVLWKLGMNDYEKRVILNEFLKLKKLIA